MLVFILTACGLAVVLGLSIALILGWDEYRLWRRTKQRKDLWQPPRSFL